MRTVEGLECFEDIKILCQYLYMSEDHKIEIHNAIGVPLELYMDEDMHIFCRNLNFPNQPATDYSEHMHPNGLLDVVDALKQEYPMDYKRSFDNRWEEIKTICKGNVVLNYD